MRGGGRVRAALAPAALLLHMATAGAAADALQCTGLPVTVVPGETALAARTCDVAAGADATFTALGLALREPVEIRLTDHIADAPESCVALYDSTLKVLEILTIDCLAEIEGGIGSFHELPPEVYFDSLIVHELTHAYLDQTGADLNRPAHEYLAYAMQFEALPQAAREALLSQTTIRGTLDISDFNELLLAFHPLRYAAMSWRHLTDQPDRAAAVAAILSGETRFTSIDD
ncbi:MAG: hypothetical protein QNJ13_13270 [Paracoccaceae bacterium]|nr:hypothetical protein [Paracoccaceae bacterium]